MLVPGAIGFFNGLPSPSISYRNLYLALIFLKLHNEKLRLLTLIASFCLPFQLRSYNLLNDSRDVGKTA